jgi:hypothetical protein
MNEKLQEVASVSNSTDYGWAFYLILLIAVAGSLSWLKSKRRQDIIEEGDKIIDKYSVQLGRDRFSNGLVDPYGIRRYEKWYKKGRKYFFENVFLEEHSARKEIVTDQSLVDAIIARIERVAIANEFSNDFSSVATSGENYEEECERILVLSGWNITRTPKTGDHGIDLIAEKGNHRVCLQCKYYSCKVGNAAVQEASAGRMHYKGTHAGVITNNSFTRKAIELAESNQVMLLHHSELQQLEKLLGQGEETATH